MTPESPDNAAQPVDVVAGIARMRKLAGQLQQDLLAGVPITDERWADLASVFDHAARECRQRIGADDPTAATGLTDETSQAAVDAARPQRPP